MGQFHTRTADLDKNISKKRKREEREYLRASFDETATCIRSEERGVKREGENEKRESKRKVEQRRGRPKKGAGQTTPGKAGARAADKVGKSAKEQHNAADMPRRRL